ncbi:MBL fold metallo-hydrolase [Phenylobacterium sp.]|uniref:MBL fold metallo-hydrolase n=1 Tax=Phenylobacterium sp. TaxID=1871053 RepID=UPI0012198DB1|nr:MBL fold metallo-hydrolase [Phenylobacterium sp.]THD51221.1 MAG: MBL fold metallo-hydrolase [Phenylobacterium sp.]
MTQSCLLEHEATTASAETPPKDPFAPGADGIGETETLAPGVYFLKGATRYFREGAVSGPAGAIRSLMCNNGWVDLGDEVLLIDANMPGRADALLAEVRRTTDKPIRYLVNTHHHGDHIYGNRPIHERTGAMIISCTEMVDELRRYETGAFGGPPGRWEQVAKLRPDVAATPIMAPQVTYDRRLVLQGSARTVELLHLTWGHTRGDTAVWLPEERILFTGDLVANGAFNIVRDGEMERWPEFLSLLEGLRPRIVCPGHGGWGDAELLSRQRTFFTALWAQVDSRAKAGADLPHILSRLEELRAALLADPSAALHVIPREADLPVLSLAAQVERVFGQLQSSDSTPPTS